MATSLKKRGQKLAKNLSSLSLRAGARSKTHIQKNLLERFSHIRNIRLLILEWSLLVLAIIMLAVAQAFWFRESYSDVVFVPGGSYIEATLGKVNSLNPLFAATSSEKALSKLMFATLTTVDYSGHIGLGIAKSLTPSENGKVWTLSLRDDLVWSDGEPLTSEDVLFTVDLIQNPAVNSVFGPNLDNVKVSQDEQGAIIFTLPSAYADFESALQIPIVPKHVLAGADPRTLVEDSFSNVPVTSGAFKFNALQSTTLSDEEVYYLSANENYYLGRPTLDSFVIHTYPTREAIANAVGGSVVTATAELFGKAAEQAATGAYREKISNINSGAFVFFNTNSLKDVELRRALRQGINVGELREYAPDTTPLDYPILESQLTLGTYPELPAYNPEAAKAKIAELAGDMPPKIRIATVNSGYLPDVAGSLAAQLNKLGIDVDFNVYNENQEFVVNIIAPREYDILVYEVELGAGHDLLPYYHSSQATRTGLNLANYRSTMADDLLMGARESTDLALQIKKYESFLNYWVSDVPAIGVYQANMMYVYNKNARIYGNDVRLVTPLDRFSDIKEYATERATRKKTP